MAVHSIHFCPKMGKSLAHVLLTEERAFARLRRHRPIHFLVALPEIFSLRPCSQQFEDQVSLSVRAMPTGAHRMMSEQIASTTASRLSGLVFKI
jgi:hypothetical protein